MTTYKPVAVEVNGQDDYYILNPELKGEALEKVLLRIDRPYINHIGMERLQG